MEGILEKKESTTFKREKGGDTCLRTPVRDETRARIFQAIAELGYQPSTYAQSLVTGRSRAIGILFPLEGSRIGASTLNTIQLEMIMEANTVAQSNGWSRPVTPMMKRVCKNVSAAGVNTLACRCRRIRFD